MNNNLSLRKIFIHVAACVAFLIFPFISSPRASIFETMQFGPPEMRGIIVSALLIMLFYVNYYVFIPVFFLKKKYLLFVLFTLAFFVIILVLPKLLIDNIHIGGWLEVERPPHSGHFPFDKPPKPNWFFRDFQLQETILKFFVVWLFAFLLRTTEMWKKSKEEKRKAELSYLKSQVNPHFLFNTLNGIYALSLQDTSKVPDAIIKLSTLMRYVLAEINNDFVPLKKEIEYLQNYIDLQKLRLGDTVDVRFHLSDPESNLLIAPLLLIPFVENAFKYGISNDEVSVIDINICIRESNELIFTISNKKSKLLQQAQSNGLGLVNLKSRLDLMYPQRHVLNIVDTEKKYFVELKLKLKK